MPDEQTPEVSPIRQEIDRLRSTPAVTNAFHPSHLQSLDTLSKLYAAESPPEGTEAPTPEAVAGLKSEVDALQAEALPVDDPAAAKIAEDLKPLRESWGADYDKNVEAAQGVTANLVAEYGIDAAEVFDVIGNHPLIVHNLFEWSQNRPGSNLTAAEAKEVITLLQKTDAYKSGASRTSETVQQIVSALYTLAYGGDADAMR